MSAIAGVVYVDGRSVSEQTLAAMEAAAPPRGFDGTTRWIGGPVGLLRTAHATTLEAVGEVQPLVDTGSGTAILFDGRLDNRGELLDLLGWHGATLTAAPDTAIALTLFERLGDEAVSHFVGDFVIAIWHPAQRRLLLLRSPGGWRPLLWTFDGKTFAFATEPRGLVLGLGLERRLNEGAIAEYLSGRFSTPTETFWQRVQRLPPGGALSLDGGKLRQWHWHDEVFEDLSRLSVADHVDRFRTLFDQALVATTRGIGPVGAQLSGGLDSSSVVCRATELHRAGLIDRQVEPISTRFPGYSEDESAFSGAVEAHLGIEATVVGAKRFDIDEASAWVAATYQLPVRPNALDTMANACSHLAAEGGRVLLTGEGGDDWLDGTLAHWPDLLRRGRFATLYRDGRRRWPDRPAHVTARRIAYFGLMPLISARHRAQAMQAQFDPRTQLPPWIRHEWAERIGLYQRWREEPPAPALCGLAQQSRYRMLSLPRRHVNFENVLAYAEGHGVEFRHPLYDLRLARFYIGAAGDAMRADGERRYILREAMRGTLPEKVRQRRDKSIFITNAMETIALRFAQRPPEQMLCVQLGWVEPREVLRVAETWQAWHAAGAQRPFPPGSLGSPWLIIAMDMWLENAFGL